MAKKIKKPRRTTWPTRSGGGRPTAVELASEEANERRKFPPLPSLKLWFKVAGVRAWQAAEAAGISETTLSNIVGGIRSYKRHHLEDIAVFVGKRLGRRVTPEMLLQDPTSPDLAMLLAAIDPQHVTAVRHVLEAFRKPVPTETGVHKPE